MLMELTTRLEALKDNQEAIKCTQRQAWMDDKGGFYYQFWNPEKKCLQPEEDTSPLPMMEVVGMLKEMVPMLNAVMVLKFHAQRPLKSAAETENKAVFYLEISLRSSIADRLYDLLRKLASNACWQIISTQIRKDSQRKSNAVQQLQTIVCGGGQMRH